MTDMVLFFSTDGDPKFGFKHCTDATLYQTVKDFMFPGHGDKDSAITDEISGIVDSLRETGAMDFEDGWLCTRTGIVDVVAFLMAKVTDAVADARYEDSQRYGELLARVAAEEKYAALRDALVTALGDKGPEIAAKAA